MRVVRLIAAAALVTGLGACAATAEKPANRIYFEERADWQKFDENTKARYVRGLWDGYAYYYDNVDEPSIEDLFIMFCQNKQQYCDVELVKLIDSSYKENRNLDVPPREVLFKAILASCFSISISTKTKE